MTWTFITVKRKPQHLLETLSEPFRLCSFILESWKSYIIAIYWYMGSRKQRQTVGESSLFNMYCYTSTVKCLNMFRSENNPFWFRDKSCLSSDLGLWLWLKTMFLLLHKSDESVKGETIRCALDLITSHLFVFDQSGSSIRVLTSFLCSIPTLRRRSQNICSEGSQDEMDELLICRLRKQQKTENHHFCELCKGEMLFSLAAFYLFGQCWSQQQLHWKSCLW